MPLLDPVLLFFLLGLSAGLLRSALRLPAAVYELVSMILLLAIGLKGGVELARQPLGPLVPQVLAVVVMGTLLTLIAFPVLRFVGRLPRADAASIAAHYGSVSVATYAVASTWFATRGIGVEAQMPFLLAVLEVPAILVGIALARAAGRQTQDQVLAAGNDVAPVVDAIAGSRPHALQFWAVLHEVFLGKGIVLLVGGLLIGWLSGPEGVAPLKPLFFDLFKGILALFLLEMGLITAAQFPSLRRHGLFLVLFGIGMPLCGSLVGLGFGLLLEFSVGGTAMLAILAASASYIAVPAAMRISVPAANPTLSLAAALGVTFPFNVLIGIPLFHALAVRAHALVHP